MEMVIFWVLAVVAVGAGLGVVAQRSAVRSALFLLVHFCCLAGLYILLNAQFVALVQVLIYAGAVVVLFLFVVMLLGVERAEELPDPRRLQRVVGGLLAVLLLAGIAWAFLETGQGPAAAPGMAGSVRALEFAYRITRRGGVTVTGGLANPAHLLGIQQVSLVGEERTLRGSYMGSSIPSRDIPRYIALHRAGRLPVDKLLTSRGPLEEINEALDALADGSAIRHIIDL